MKQEATNSVVGYVYIIYNNQNEKVYVGETITTLKRRFREHILAANNPNSHIYNNKLYRAMRKYGTSNFFIKEIDRVIGEDRKKVKDEIQELEVLYIKKYDSFKNGYNSDSGGNGGKIVSEEVKKKQSDIKKNDPKTEERIEYARSFRNSEKAITMYNYNTGEQIKKYSSAKEASIELGIDASSITKCCKKKINYRTTENNLKVTFRYSDESYIPNYIVEVYTDCDLISEKFITIADGAKKYKVDQSSITRCCKGKNSYAGTFKGIQLKWRYINNEARDD